LAPRSQSMTAQGSRAGDTPFARGDTNSDSTILDIKTVEMHTGGEPVRIVASGYPDIPGNTLLDKRRNARDELDHLRKFLIFEPRGHFDMYAALPVAPDLPDCNLAVLFLHNEGYSTMCGHAVIALGRYAVDRGLVPKHAPETVLRIQCPCGPVTTRVSVRGQTSGEVRFESVPAFAYALDKDIETASFGKIHGDIGYGGAFYCVLPASRLGLDVRVSPVEDLVMAATEITEAAKLQVPIVHPNAEDLSFLYGTILTDGRDSLGADATRNICVFANAEVDRSPTGSGVTARLALQYSRGLIGRRQRRDFESVTGARFSGQVLEETTCGPYPAIIAEVGGKAHYTGESRFILEADDEIGRGFLLS